MIANRQTNALADEQLMARTREGDRTAFETLYGRHSAFVFRLALRVTRRHRAAEEATQDVFLGLWLNAGSFDPKRGDLRAWLAAAVRNRSIDWLRREARHDGQAQIDEAVVNGLVADEGTEEKVVRRAEAKATRRLLDDLPSEQRRVIELAYFGQLTQTEIAARAGVALGTVKGRQRLALGRLRRQIEAAPAGLRLRPSEATCPGAWPAPGRVPSPAPAARRA